MGALGNLVELSDMQKFFLKSCDPKQTDKAATAVLLPKGDKRAFLFAGLKGNASATKFTLGLQSHNELALKFSSECKVGEQDVKFVLMCPPNECGSVEINGDGQLCCDGWFVCASDEEPSACVYLSKSSDKACKVTVDAENGSICVGVFVIGLAQPAEVSDAAKELRSAFYQK